jgi:hypothetical protein
MQRTAEHNQAEPCTGRLSCSMHSRQDTACLSRPRAARRAGVARMLRQQRGRPRPVGPRSARAHRLMATSSRWRTSASSSPPPSLRMPPTTTTMRPHTVAVCPERASRPCRAQGACCVLCPAARPRTPLEQGSCAFRALLAVFRRIAIKAMPVAWTPASVCLFRTPLSVCLSVCLFRTPRYWKRYWKRARGWRLTGPRFWPPRGGGGSARLLHDAFGPGRRLRGEPALDAPLTISEVGGGPETEQPGVRPYPPSVCLSVRPDLLGAAGGKGDGAPVPPAQAGQLLGAAPEAAPEAGRGGGLRGACLAMRGGGQPRSRAVQRHEAFAQLGDAVALPAPKRT